MEVKNKLFQENIINPNEIITDSQKLAELLPDTIQNGIIRNNPKDKIKKVKLIPDNWKKIKDLWKEVSKRYILEFKDLENKDFNDLLTNSLKESFQPLYGKVKRQSLEIENGQIKIK
jgi:restriction endonuclease